MSQRAMKYLNNERIVYRRYSTDEPLTAITVCLILRQR